MDQGFSRAQLWGHNYAVSRICNGHTVIPPNHDIGTNLASELKKGERTCPRFREL